MLSSILIASLPFVPVITAQRYSATYLPSSVPAQTEEGQAGTNRCEEWGESSQDSLCQNAYINSLEDFCIWGPPYSDGVNATIGTIERVAVAYCTRPGYGTRLIPDGTILGAHFIQTENYVQITGVGDFTKIGIPAGDSGGEMDPHGADGNGNPIGGLVFSSAFGQLQQVHEWTNFQGATEFCLRACKDSDPSAPQRCEHIYDVLGCRWNIPADYSSGTFDSCSGDTAPLQGIYGSSTFHQGDPVTPDPHPIPASSNCRVISALPTNGAAAWVPPGQSSSSSTTTTTSSSSTQSGSSQTTGTGQAQPTTTSGAAGNNGGNSAANGLKGGGFAVAVSLGGAMMAAFFF
ncbi:hypothetical protein BT69DRAFT_161671 [Atractiella rhizophila]|nr:hypothetical protein BT69DRAFT_161671 [Atractiella rhizophila]